MSKRPQVLVPRSLREKARKADGRQSKSYQKIAEVRRLKLQERILELRIQGLSEKTIAEQVVKEGIVEKCGRDRVSTLLIEALDKITIPEAEKLKRLELERLDNIINGHYENATNGDVGATHAVLACIDRRNRLLGIGIESKVTSQTLGADGKPIDPIRPVINLTITRGEEPALPAPTIDVPVAKRLN